MKTISFSEAVLRSRYTEHGRMLLEVVRKKPGIHLETLVGKHDPAPRSAMEQLLDPQFFGVLGSRPGAKLALRRFPAGGRAVKQLCDAGALVITEELGVYRPEDLPEWPVGEPLTEVPENSPEEPPGGAEHENVE